MVRPDMGMQLGDGSMVDCVSREAMQDAFMDALAIIDHAGGFLSIGVARVATDIPGEMLTSRLMIEWKDRTHATTSPERPSVVTRESRPVVYDSGEPDPDPTPEVLEARLEAEVDGLDPSTLDEVDESSIPEPAR